MKAWPRWAAVVLGLGLVASGCAVEGLSFVADKRVEIVGPDENEKVSLPFELDWTAKDFEGRFVVFFDRSPMKPGKTLLSVVPKDDPCRARRGCPDAEWLRGRNIYVTDETRLVVESLPDERDNNRMKDRHDFTIALLDERGRRVGESAFTREFVVERED